MFLESGATSVSPLALITFLVVRPWPPDTVTTSPAAFFLMSGHLSSRLVARIRSVSSRNGSHSGGNFS